MAFKQDLKTWTGIGKLLASSLIILSLLFITLSLSCQAPASEPAPAAEPEPAVTEEEPAATTTSVTVDIAGFAFSPATITVSVGTTVTWTNQDSAAHTVTSETDLFDSGSLANGAVFSHTFSDRGTFSYFCAFHPYMKGTVIVE